MKLYHFPSPNPQKVRFALLELGLDCEIVPVDLTKGEHRNREFLALNPYGRVPVLIDGDLTLWESHAILAYLGEKAGKMWPTSAAGRADALRWLFFLSGHVTRRRPNWRATESQSSSSAGSLTKTRSRAAKKLCLT